MAKITVQKALQIFAFISIADITGSWVAPIFYQLTPSPRAQTIFDKVYDNSLHRGAKLRQKPRLIRVLRAAEVGFYMRRKNTITYDQRAEGFSDPELAALFAHEICHAAVPHIPEIDADMWAAKITSPQAIISELEKGYELSDTAALLPTSIAFAKMGAALGTAISKDTLEDLSFRRKRLREFYNLPTAQER